MQMNNLSSKLVGLILIVIGIGYLGDQLDVWTFSIFFRGWWALLLALWGVFLMIENRPNIFNVIITVLGIYWFMSANHLIHFVLTYKVIFAGLLIYIGCKVLFSNMFSSKTNHDKQREGDNEQRDKNKTTMNDDTHLVINSSFSTRRYVSDSKIYSCRLNNSFGSLFVDLSSADLSEIYEIRIENVLGSLELLLPSDVKIISKEDNVLSSCYVDQSAGQKEVYIKENCVLGSMKIMKAKNK